MISIDYNLQLSGLVEVSTIIPDIILDIKYSTTDNFTNTLLYKNPLCYLLNDVVGALAFVQNDLKALGLKLKIWDAYRPSSVQKILRKYCPNPEFVAIISNHSRGIAVDVTLVNANSGEEIEMPTPFDDFTPKANAICIDISHKAIENRKILFTVMEKYGFSVYPSEWWHFDFLSLQDSQVLDIAL